MTAVIVLLVVVLVALPLAAVALGELFGWVESQVERVRARRVAHRPRTAPGSHPRMSRGHNRDASPEQLRNVHGYGRFR